MKATPKDPGRPISLRINAEQRASFERAAKEAGHPSVSAFIKAAALSAARGQDAANELAAIEQRVAVSFENQSKRLRAIENSTQLHLAVLDGLTKVLLTCLVEPAPDTLNAARARAKLRYDKLMRAVALDMTGDVAGVVAALGEAAQRGD